MRLIASFAALCAVATLAGCVESTPIATTAATTFPPTAADKASPAYQSCLAAIARTTGRPASDVAIYSFLFSEANTEVLATVAGAEAPWRCLSSTGGVVAEVTYTGSEGAL